MTKSIFTAQYDRLCSLLIQARIDAGFSQAELAKCLKRPQSFVSKYETKQRRLDVVEFLEVVHCIKASVPEFLERLTDASADSENASAIIAKSSQPSTRSSRSPGSLKHEPVAAGASKDGQSRPRRSQKKR